MKHQPINYITNKSAGGATPLVLLHGFTGSPENMVELADINRPTFCIELPGHRSQHYESQEHKSPYYKNSNNKNRGNQKANNSYFTFNSINKQLLLLLGDIFENKTPQSINEFTFSKTNMREAKTDNDTQNEHRNKSHENKPQENKPQESKIPKNKRHESKILGTNTQDKPEENKTQDKTNSGTKKIHLLGYSMGGRVALNFAVCYPHHIKSLTLISATAGLATRKERQLRKASDAELATKIESDFTQFVEDWTELPLFSTQTEEQKAALKKQRLQGNPTELALSLKGYGTGQMKPLYKKLKNIKSTCLLITGAEDEKFCHQAKEMQMKLDDAIHLTIANTSHAPHIEKPVLVRNLISNFLTHIDSISS